MSLKSAHKCESTAQDENHRTTTYTYRAFAHPDDVWLVWVQLPGEPEPIQDTYRYLVGGHRTAEIAPGGSSPSIARLGDQLHAASVVISGTVWNPMNELVYVRRSPGSGWTPGANPSSGTATTENTPSASVNFNTSPGQAIDPAGGRHLAWSQGSGGAELRSACTLFPDGCWGRMERAATRFISGRGQFCGRQGRIERHARRMWRPRSLEAYRSQKEK